MARRVVDYSRDMSFARTREKLQAAIGRSPSENTIRRLTCEVGRTADLLEQEAGEQVRQERHAMPALQAGRLYMESDGVMVHRQEGWKEVKAFICRWEDAQGRGHQRYLCRNESAEDFAPMAWALAHRCGLDNARQSVLLGDGIPWIWNHLGPIADEAVQILDWYHACEHLWTMAKAVEGEGTPACQALAKTLKDLLWESRIDDLLALLAQEKKRLRGNAKRDAVDSLTSYIHTHRQRMDYQSYRAQGLTLGSGAVEGACENHVHARMKRGHPRWSYQGCQSMLSLRSCYANGQQANLWNRMPMRVS
jgi:hypothetical protein